MICSLSCILFLLWKHISQNSVWKNSFWIPPMMLTLSMNTADRKTSHLLSALTPDIPDTLLIRTISPLMTMVSQSVNWVYVCTKTDTRLPNTVRNTGVQKQTSNRAVSANIPAHRWNAAGPYTFLRMTIQGCLTYRQGTASHGKRNMTEENP